MHISETANLIELLEGLGFNGEQINKFILAVENRISIAEAIDLIKKLGNKNNENN